MYSTLVCTIDRDIFDQNYVWINKLHKWKEVRQVENNNNHKLRLFEYITFFEVETERNDDSENNNKENNNNNNTVKAQSKSTKTIIPEKQLFLVHKHAVEQKNKFLHTRQRVALETDKFF